MNYIKFNMLFKSLGVFIFSLGLSFVFINKASGEEISDSVLKKYGENAKNITDYKITRDNLEMGSSETVKKIIAKLQSEDAKVRAGAASILSTLYEEKAVVTALIQALQDKDAKVRSNAAYSLGEIGTGNQPQLAVPALIQALQDKDATVRSQAAYGLYSIGNSNPSSLSKEVPALIRALKDDDSQVRSNAVKALGTLREKVLSAFLAEFIKALKDNDSEVRSYAAESLGRLKDKAESSVPNLIEALKDDDAKVRSSAVGALERLGDKTAVKPLIEALKDDDAKVRSSAAEALGRLGDKTALKPLIEALKDDDVKVRSFAAKALGSIGDKAAVKPLTEALEEKDLKDIEFRFYVASALIMLGETAVIEIFSEEFLENQNLQIRFAAVWALGDFEEKAPVQLFIKALEDKSPDIRINAMENLERIGNKAILTLPALIDNLKHDNSRVSFYAPIYVVMFVENYRNQAEKLSFQELEKGIVTLEKALKELEATEKELKQDFAKPKLSINNALSTLQKEKDSRLIPRIVEWMVKHPWFAAVIIYIIFLPSLWSSLLLIRPLWLLKINQKLQPLSNIQLPEALGGLTISIPGIIFLEPFTYHPRVLDAWVATHIKVARDNFSQKKTVSNRAEHISLPVILNKKTVANFSGNDLKDCFDKKLTNILIHAEGGSGKTSLACQLAKWGMSDDVNIRPSKHRMLPVLIEQELDVDGEGNQAFLQEISGQLQVLIGESQVIPTKLVENLLRQRRILVIIDHFSEMSEATRKQIRPASPNFPANALIVTSRLEESLDNVPKTTLKPLRVSGNQLSSFMEAYLTQRGKRDLFDDAEYFDACRRLSLMVGKRNITALFAKLYAEQMIGKVVIEQDDFVDDLPLSIPELMLGYLNELNRETTEGELDNRSLQKDAKIIAWECLKKTFRPGNTKLDDVVAVLDNQDSINARLQHLEKRLRIIQINEPARDKVRFALDPLAEYLAALYLVDSYGQDKDKWMEFINQAKSVKDLDAIQGFLLAVQDCCVANPEEVPDFIVSSLSELTGVVLTASQNTKVLNIF